MVMVIISKVSFWKLLDIRFVKIYFSTILRYIDETKNTMKQKRAKVSEKL